MSQAEVLTIMKDAIYTTIIASAPMLIAAIVIGLIISIFQATTQINEQTIAFVPKILAVFIVLLLFGGFIMSTLSNFTLRIYESIGSMLT